MKKREDFQSLSGPEKAAVFMLSLGEEYASKIFAMMDEDEIREISQRMVVLGNVTSPVVEKLFLEFAENISATGSLVGSYESTERLLTKIMNKDQAKNIMEDIRGPAGRTMWDKLGNVDSEILANFLKNEYPQTIAVVISKVKGDHAAKVLAQLPDDLSLEVIQRLLKMEPVQREILDDIERTLRTEFMSNVARTSKRDPHELIAEVFGYMDRNVEAKYMGYLEEKNADSAERVKALMFTFDDLIRLDQNGLQTLIRNVDKTKLPLALKGAGDSIKDLFFKNMSERAGKLLKEEMMGLGLVRLKDVDEAQSNIISTAKGLAEKGELVLLDRKGEADEMIS
jgi:flagellar motor switch protein FliG